MRNLLLIFSLLFFTACNSLNMSQLKLISQNGELEFEVELARTEEERNKGLMNRKSLPKDSGMFFIFEEEEVLGFWMKNTLIPLDMIFIDEDFKVVHIDYHAEPCPKGTESCPVYSSEYPAKYVLEINADLSKEKGIKEGDLVKIDL